MSGETHADGRVGPLREGAAEGAPTAPHATPDSAGGRPRSGPARFWDRRRVRRALAAALVLSVGLHALFSPWTLFPEKGLEVREVEGELSIAIETEDDPTPPPPPPPPPAPTPPPETPNSEGIGSTKRDAGPKDAGPKDAGPKDAGPKDAGHDAEIEDGGPIPLAELGDAGPRDASGDGARIDDASAIALGDDGGSGAPGANGPRDPAATIGAAGNVQADVPLVQLLVNVAEIRKNPVGAKMGPLLSAIPEWDSFIAGTNVDPIRDTEWIYMSGPSLYTKRTSKLAIIVRYGASDAVVDHALEVVSKKYASGGPFDAGVPGVRALLGHADFAPRVFLRPQSHVLAVVPPDYAHTAAKILAKAKINPKVRPGEAMRLTLKNPSRPFPFLPTTLKELRLWIVPHEDGSADVFGEADTDTPDQADDAAKQIRRVVREQNSLGVQIVTKGILNRAEAVPDGSVVRIKVPATEEQIQSIFDFLSAYLGVGKK